MLGGLGIWVLVVGAWAWAWGLELELETAHFEGMEAGVAVGGSWDLVARRGVGVVLGGLDLVGLVEGLSKFAGGIFLLRRCLRASGWLLVLVGMVAEARTCLRVVCRMTWLMIVWMIVSMSMLIARVRRSGCYGQSVTHARELYVSSLTVAKMMQQQHLGDDVLTSCASGVRSAHVKTERLGESLNARSSIYHQSGRGCGADRQAHPYTFEAVMSA